MDISYLNNQKVSNNNNEVGTVTEVITNPDGNSSITVDYGNRTAKFWFFRQGFYLTKFLTFEDKDIQEKLLKDVEDHKKQPVEKMSKAKPVAPTLVFKEPASEEDVIRFGKTHELYGGFSNFNGPTFYDGRQYKCSEAAWQSMKTMDPAERDKFVPLSGGSAKSKGRKVTLRPDWEQIKNQLMVDVCYAKFTQNKDLKEILLSTGEKTLIEDTTKWHDNYWGDCQCPKCKNKPGLNHLGIALMTVRKMIRDEEVNNGNSLPQPKAENEPSSSKSGEKEEKKSGWSDAAKRKEIFEDTLRLIEENETLKEKTRKSVDDTEFYGEKESVSLPENPGKSCRVTVTEARTFEGAVRLFKEYPNKRIAVLNFASAARPGGGVTDGKGAQEECLCRVSTLYPTLNTEKMMGLFYEPHKKEKNNLHNDDCIYSPGVVICKSDENFPERISEAEFVTVDVITCAAPNLSEKSVKKYNPDAGRAVALSNEELYKLHLKRTKRILSVCALNGADIVVLGAFGCGVFKNDPATVARAMMDACKEMDGYFDRIDFAIKRGRDKSNYEAFASII